MTDARQTPVSDEQHLLDHVRRHSSAEPSARLDAFILETARHELPVPKPGLWQRWLDACRQPRWQVAFASLFGVALIVGLLQRSPEHYPVEAFVPAPAPAPAKSLAESSPVEFAHPGLQAIPSAPADVVMPALVSAPAAPMAGYAAASGEMFSDEVAAQQMSEPRSSQAKALASKRVVVRAAALDEQLREILRLRKAGQNRAADEQLIDLQKRHPDLDIPAWLEALQQP